MKKQIDVKKEAITKPKLTTARTSPMRGPLKATGGGFGNKAQTAAIIRSIGGVTVNNKAFRKLVISHLLSLEGGRWLRTISFVDLQCNSGRKRNQYKVETVI